MQLRHQNQQKFLIFDTETECVNLARTRPWQVSWQVYEGQKLIDSQDRFPHWEDINVSAGAAFVTGFTKERYLSLSEDNRSVYESFKELVLNPDYLLVGHNILGFDVMVIRNWARAFGEDLGYEFLNRCVDTLCLEKAIRANTEISRETLFEDQMKLCFQRVKGTSLAALGTKYDIAFDPKKLHDSLEDIKLNNQVFRKQLWKMQTL